MKRMRPSVYNISSSYLKSKCDCYCFSVSLSTSYNFKSEREASLIIWNEILICCSTPRLVGEFLTRTESTPRQLRRACYKFT